MATATFIRLKAKGDVTQTTYELSEPITYKRWNGVERKTKHIVVSHARYDGVDESAVFPGTYEGEITSYIDLFTSVPMCNDETALSALGLTRLAVTSTT